MLFLDVDAVSKLAHWNILPQLPEITGSQWGSMTTLSSLIHRAHRASEKPDGKLFKNMGAALAAKHALEKMAQVSAQDEQVLAQLANFPGIDAGEAVLLAQVAHDGKARLLTGDKRAIRQLAKTELAARFSGRILILEQVVMRCLLSPGRDWLLQNVCPHRDIDKAISNCLGANCNASAQHISEGLRSYIGEIDGLTDPSLLALVEPQAS